LKPPLNFTYKITTQAINCLANGGNYEQNIILWRIGGRYIAMPFVLFTITALSLHKGNNLASISNCRVINTDIKTLFQQKSYIANKRLRLYIA
jgi:hypothetical protein